MPSIPIGHSTVNNETFSLSPADRNNHMAIFGVTGVGKTTLMANMIAADLHASRGVTVLDPHGGLIDEVLKVIPADRTNDVIYLNPAAAYDRVIGVNLLDAQEQDHQLVVACLINIFKNLWPDAWGPRSEFILSNFAQAALSASASSPQTLLVIYQLLTDPAYRQQLAAGVDPFSASFFDIFDRQWAKGYREEAAAPVLNKVNAFVRNKHLRAVIGQRRSSFSFRELLDHSKILLCQLPKGRLGPDVPSMIGSIVVIKLFLAALSREDILEDQRRPHYLYADEFQTFTHGVDLPTILAESRKYALFATIATQTLSLLPESDQLAIVANCNTIASFRVSGKDAYILEREFASPLPARELQSLSNRELYLRTIQAGAPAGPYLLRTFPPRPTTADPPRIIRMSLARYGEKRSIIESKIKQRLVPAPAKGKKR